MQSNEKSPGGKPQGAHKSPLTDAERQERFVGIVSEVEASTAGTDFDAVFEALNKREKPEALASEKPV